MNAVESLADLPGVRVSAEQRCPVCDGRMEAGMWAVEAGGQLVDRFDCYTTLAMDRPDLEGNEEAEEDLIDKIQNLIDELEHEAETARDQAIDLQELLDEYHDGSMTLQELKEKWEK